MMKDVLAFLLLLSILLRSSTSSLPPPRTSFLLNSSSRPLLRPLLREVFNTTALLLSDDGATLYVGARDAVISLDVSRSDVIRPKQQVRWSPSESGITSCEVSGKSRTAECLNFVQVLQPMNSTHLYACGSFAFSPQHAFIDTETFSLVGGDVAKGRCPFSPFQRSSATIIDGELFTASTADFRGIKPQISRWFSRDGRPDVSLDSSVSLLEEPVFISSSSDPSHRKLYFFFSEVGTEFSFVGKLRIARVAQVCKDDVGGQRTLQKKWTSFAKASLLCQTPRQLPYTELQDVFTLQPPEGANGSDTLFYSVFTSQWSAGSESAVCVFRLQDIRTAFAGSYRAFDMESHQWSPLVEKHSYLGQCGLDTSSDSELEKVKKSFLTSGGVKPVGGGPLLVSSQQRYSRVVVMTTPALDGTPYTILFLLTESGFLHKTVLSDGGPRIVEEIQVFAGPQPVQSLVLAASKGFLYVGSSEGVTAVPVANCSTYRTCGQCVLARDPLCGWSRTGRVCASLSGGDKDLVQNLKEGGDVDQDCRGQTETVKDEVMGVHLGGVVELPCLTPSNLAVLTWTSSRFKRLPEALFIQSADGSLSFLARSATLGTYRCQAEEGGHREVVASYHVQQVASPRSISPPPTSSGPAGREILDEPYDVIETESDDPSPTDQTDRPGADGSLTQSFRQDTGSQPGPDIRRQEPKSYYSELVVVSLLLVACVALLAGGSLYVWRQRWSLPKPDDQSNKPLELGGLTAAGPEAKVQE